MRIGQVVETSSDDGPRRAATRRGVLRTGAGLLTGGGAVLAAACSAGGLGGEGAAPAKPAAPVEIEYWSTLRDTHPTGIARINALKLSEQANADYFRIKYAEGGGANIEKMIAALAADTPPNLVVDYPYWAARLHLKGGLVKLEDELKKQPTWQKHKNNLPAGFLEGNQWLGAMVGIPFQISQQAMVYAPQHLERAGIRPPVGTQWTWTDFEEIAKRATRLPAAGESQPPGAPAGAGTDAANTVVWGLSTGWRSSGFTTWAASNGTSWVNKDQTKISFTHPEAMAGVEMLYKFTHGLGIMPKSSLTEMIVTNQTVFEPNGPYRFPQFKQAGVRFEGILFPRGPHKPTSYNWGTLYSFIVFKSPDAAKQRASVQAALGALSDDAQAAHAVADYGLPVTKTAKDAPAYKQLLAQEPQMKTFADMFPYCQVDPAIPVQGEMRRIMDATMLRIRDQQEGIKNALLTAEVEVQRLHDEDLRAAKK